MAPVEAGGAAAGTEMPGESVGTGLCQPGGFGAQRCAARRASDGGFDELGAASTCEMASSSQRMAAKSSRTGQG
jgi:hypothetical protein